MVVVSDLLQAFTDSQTVREIHNPLVFKLITSRGQGRRLALETTGARGTLPRRRDTSCLIISNNTTVCRIILILSC